MSYPLDTTDIEPRVIIAGPGRVYLGAYTDGGADCPSSVFIGASEGGVEIHHAYTRHAVGCDQALNDVEVIPVKEQVTIKVKALQLNLANVYKVLAQVDPQSRGGMTLVGGTKTDASSNLKVGEQLGKLYWQLGVSTPAPPGATSRLRVYTFFKAAFMTQGPTKYEKTKESSVDWAWQALTDFSIGDPTARIYAIHES
jgi:hypothetical protein